MAEVLLEIKDLKVAFDSRFGVVNALNGVDLQIHKGESLGIVGESGSGKSVTALSILQLLSPNATVSAQHIMFEGENLLQKSEKEMLKIRGGKISMIFQDPSSSLNPVLTVGRQVEEAFILHSPFSKKARREKLIDMLRLVGIPDPVLNMKGYPHQFSGGMNQRVMIAIAISCNPSLMIADEPTTALDVTTQAQILDLLKYLMDEKQTSLLMITHDFGIVKELCERICVMYGGEILEEGDAKDVLFSPLHPYTRGLIDCIPKVESSSQTLRGIPGEVVKGTHLPSGCVFHPRCEKVQEICVQEKPALVASGNHQVRCFRFDMNKRDRWKE
jgi:peptide/nickel transport system ATP-binding protein